MVTNTTPVGAYRGAGRPEATAAIERAIDLFAAEIGMDPAEVRRRNLLPPFTEPHTNATGALYDSGDYAGGARTWCSRPPATPICGPSRPRRRERGDVVQLGIGLSRATSRSPAAATSPGAPNENAQVEVHPDGTATILTGTSPHGQGHATAWAMLASDELGIPVERITVMHGDTDLIPEGGGTGGSRSLQQGGAAVRQAAPRAGRAWPSSGPRTCSRPTPTTWCVDTSTGPRSRCAGAPDSGVTLRRPGRARSGCWCARCSPRPARRSRSARTCAVVEVDTDTGKVVLQRLVAVDDAGRVLNPLLAEGQRHGGIAQGAAQALFEEMVYDDDGNPLTATFADYPFLSATELPSFELVDHGDADRRTTRWAPRASGRPARSARRLPCRTPSSTRWRTWACGTSTCPPRRCGCGGPSTQAAANGRQRDAACTITVNGATAQRTDEVEPRQLLVHYLRDTCGLRAANVGCDTTSCGACTVLLDGESVKSCTVLAVQADGGEVTTVEGLADRR